MRISTWISVALCMLLGLFLWKGDEWGVSRDSGSVLVAIPRDRVTRLVVAKGDGTRSVLARKDSGWRLTEPGDHETDHEAVDRLMGAVEKFDLIRKVADQPEDLAGYGLVKPSWIVTVTEASGTLTTLAFGGKTVDDKAWYVSVGGNPAVYTTSLWTAASLQKTSTDLRKKELFSLPAGEGFERIVVKGVQAKEFSRTAGGEWRVNGLPADPMVMDRLVWGLSKLQASGFPDDAPKQKASFGLAAPRGEILGYGKSKPPWCDCI